MMRILVGVRGFFRNIEISGKEGKPGEPLPWLLEKGIGVREGSKLDQGLRGNLRQELLQGIVSDKEIQEQLPQVVVPFLFDRGRSILEYRNYKELLSEGKRFLVLIPLETNLHRVTSRDIDFPQDVLEAVKKQQCKVVFSILQEGNMYPEDVKKLSEAGMRMGIPITVLSGNLKLKQLVGEKYTNIHIVEECAFMKSLWFLEESRDLKGTEGLEIEERDRIWFEYSYNRKMRVPGNTSRFLSLSRVTRPERMIVSSYLIGKYLDKSQVSFLNIQREDIAKMWRETVSENLQKKLGEHFRKFLQLLESNRGKLTIRSDFDSARYFGNQAFTTCRAFYTTGLSIITETLASDSNTLFITEKTFKPMFALQPFLLVGNVGSLQELHRQGFKTFDRWWDESYDLEEDFEQRILKIFNVIDQIALLTDSEFEQILVDMKEVLEYNFHHLQAVQGRYGSELLDVLRFAEIK